MSGNLIEFSLSPTNVFCHAGAPCFFSLSFSDSQMELIFRYLVFFILLGLIGIIDFVKKSGALNSKFALKIKYFYNKIIRIITPGYRELSEANATSPQVNKIKEEIFDDMRYLVDQSEAHIIRRLSHIKLRFYYYQPLHQTIGSRSISYNNMSAEQKRIAHALVLNQCIGYYLGKEYFSTN